MIDIAFKNTKAYADRYELMIGARLGFGIHGIVQVARNKINKDKSAIKAHFSAVPFLRELAAYERLKDAGVSEILGFHVPELIRADSELQVIEMTIVTRPFVLDFAGAYLDAPPEFSDEVWAEWEVEKREQFGARWTTVQSLLGALEELDIHLIDVTPNNIAFLS
jgi:hypothetical protein